ncbi:conserved exported protein of unknown function [Rhodovastum atsumiense]|uniref:DUF3857 domain-containing protein n=1 Tax=Rhodovastum atsumiense TaxID=504468 RepID=A0A5M6IKU3_9PROT|nr:DUF3857 domain-containing protein [Rhodovastum atsumiense]KAA5608886.1 DUF3857 domain-containing protein [Rhodovastum atsumiense]CAH2602316.1 conserved exported protein of unknown function [Rhodovastum atsumiense]
MSVWVRLGIVASAATFSGLALAAEPPLRTRAFLWDIEVHEDGTAVGTQHLEFAVANDAIARRQAQQARQFSEAIEQVELVEGYTQKPDGRRIPVEPRAVRTQLAPGTPNLPLYTDRKQIVAVLPDAAGGDLLVTTWRWTLTHPVVPGEFSFGWAFPRTTPWDSVEVRITTPAGKPLRTEAHGPVLEESTATDGRHVYHWHYRAPDALAEDPAALAPFDRAPRLFASTFADWPAFSRDYAAVVAPQAAVTPRLRTLAEEVTAGTTDRREQARLLYDWVSRHVRWVAIWLGNDGWVPHTAESVLDRGYGDCKDQATLLVALLRARGIAAEPVLINLAPTYTLSEPPVFRFDHTITYLPDWDLYADTTAGGAPFGTLPLREYGKPVLRVTAAGAAPGRIAPLPPEVATEHLSTRATLAADGTVSGTSTTQASGPYVTALRIVGRAIVAQEPRAAAARQLRTLHQDGEGEFTAVAAEGTEPQASSEGRFALVPHPGWVEGDSFMMPTGLRLLQRTGDGPIGPLERHDLPALEPTPCHAGRQEEELTLMLPSGTRPARLPRDVAVDGSFFRYESHWSFTEGAVRVRRSLVSTTDQALCEGARRAEAARALPAIRRDIDARISLEKID